MHTHIFLGAVRKQLSSPFVLGVLIFFIREGISKGRWLEFNILRWPFLIQSPPRKKERKKRGERKGKKEGRKIRIKYLFFTRIWKLSPESNSRSLWCWPPGCLEKEKSIKSKSCNWLRCNWQTDTLFSLSLEWVSDRQTVAWVAVGGLKVSSVFWDSNIFSTETDKRIMSWGIFKGFSQFATQINLVFKHVRFLGCNDWKC